MQLTNTRAYTHVSLVCEVVLYKRFELKVIVGLTLSGNASMLMFSRYTVYLWEMGVDGLKCTYVTPEVSPNTNSAHFRPLLQTLQLTVKSIMCAQPGNPRMFFQGSFGQKASREYLEETVL